jgi:putative ABC transport system permease protein
MIFDLWRDVVYAVRTLAKSPSLTAVALLAIALAIGANTAVYSVIDALIHFPIPSDDPAHTALVFSENPEGGVTEGGVSTDDYLDWPNRPLSSRRSSPPGRAVTTWWARGEPLRMEALSVTSGFFAALVALGD